MTATTLRYGIVGLSFVAVVIVFAIAAKWVLDLDSLRKVLSENDWLKVLQPEIAQLLLTRGLPVIVAALAAHWVYQNSEPLANWLARRFNPPQALQALPVSRDLLDLGISKLPVVGRDQELEELRRFAEGKPRVLWWWLTGNDSVGRNRLVHEWRTHLKGWDVGAPRFGIDESFCKAFQPRRPTVLVVEDAAKHSREIPLIIAALAACASDFSHPIRILLVEQSIPQALEVLNAETRYFQYRYRREPLELPTLGTDAVQSLAVAIERLSGRSVPLSANHKAALLEATGGLEFLVIIALNRLAETGEIEPPGTQTLLSEQSERLRTRFEHLGLRHSNIPLLILASLVGGLPWKDAEPFAPKDGQLDRALCERLLHQNCYRAIPPIAPPLLGYAFVLNYFSFLGELEQRRIMEAAWRLAPERVAWTLAMMYVNFRAHPEFAHLNQRPESPELLEP